MVLSSLAEGGREISHLLLYRLRRGEGRSDSLFGLIGGVLIAGHLREHEGAYGRAEHALTRHGHHDVGEERVAGDVMEQSREVAPIYHENTM